MNRRSPLPPAPSILFWCVAVAGLSLGRWPYVSSPLYLLDNDEAVLGIMARRLAEAGEVQLFFAGQNYGLAILETAPIAAAFSLFGASPEVMTATVLALFFVGLLLFARVFRDLTDSRAWGRALALVMAMVPGWIVWSTKARGLYVSGFLLTGVLLVLMHPRSVAASEVPVLTRGRMLVLGGLSGILALVQPLWLLVVAPFAVVLAVEAPRRDVVAAVVLGLAVWVIPTVALMGREAFWRPDRIGPLWPGPGIVPRSLSRAFAGIVPPNPPTPLATLAGWLGTATFFGVMAVLALEAFRDRSRGPLLVAGAMLLSVAHVFVLRYWVPRYFLPATVLTFVGLAMLIGRRRPPFRGAALAGTSAALALLLAASLTMGQPPTGSALGSVSARADLEGLVEGLEEDGVRGVYAASSDLQWQILFYGRGAIPVRGRSVTDRYPEFPTAVERARRAGEPTALVADVRRLRTQIPELGGFPGYRVGERYLRLDDPSDLVLSLLSFELEGDGDEP